LDLSNFVTNKAGDYAEIGAKIANPTSKYDLHYEIYPAKGGGKTTDHVWAEETTLNVPGADYIKAYSQARNRNGYVSGMSIEVSKADAVIPSASLTGYTNFAYASADLAEATQSIGSTSGRITINTGSFTWGSDKNIPKGRAVGQWVSIVPEAQIITTATGTISGAGGDLGYTGSAIKTSGSAQVTQNGHVTGSFTSTSSATGASPVTRTSDYGTDFDLNIKATKGSSADTFGHLGYYVDGAKTWQGSPMTIQGGVNAAQSGDIINVAAGEYLENVVIDKSLDIVGEGATETIVNGHQAGSVFTIGESNKDVQVTLSGLSITGGSKWYVYGMGGGILNYGKLDLEKVEIFNNYADLGGGIYNCGLLNLISGSIHDNSAIRDGGGINNGGTLFIDGGSIYKNTANWGGGIYDYGTLTMDGGTISGNSADGWAANGGGICIDRGGTATINGGSITLNNAWRGGGIYRGYIGTNSLILNGGTITGNTPQDVY